MLFSSSSDQHHQSSQDHSRQTPTKVPLSHSSSSWQIPPELVGHLEHREIIRQSIIHEIISGEAEFLDDLNTYYKIFIEPLQDELSPTIFQHLELQRFLAVVVSSLNQIRRCSRLFLKRLRYRQQAQQPLVECIADVILTAVLEWGPAYIRYAADHPLGEMEIERQINQNLLFAEHISNIPHFNSRKKDFRHFYSRATFRLARYVLLFTRLLDATPEDHIDREPLRFALDFVRRQCSECNAAIEAQQDGVRLLKLNSMIALKSDLPLLHLDSPHRKIYFSGKMLRKKDAGSGMGEWSEVLVVMFDHYLVILKKKKDDGNSASRYHILEQPIRAEFLKVGGFDLPPEKRSSRFKNLTNGLLGSNFNTGGLSAPSSPVRIPARRSKSEPGPRYQPHIGLTLDFEPSSSLQQSRSLYPITLQPFGVPPRIITLYVESESARKNWQEHFETAINDRLQSIKTSQVFELWPMALETFSIPSSSSSSSLANLPSLAELKILYEDHIPKELLPNSVHHGAPTCSVPFISLEGRPLIAIGCKEGLWIGKPNNSSSFRKVLSLKNISQVGVFQNEGYMVVLAGQLLLAYPLNVLVHTPGMQPSLPNRPRSVVANPNPNYLPKPPRPAVPYHSQQSHQQILSRATSASSQQSTWSRHSRIGTDTDSCHTSHSSIVASSLGLFGFESKPSNEDESALLSSGCDEVLDITLSPKKSRRIDTVSVPNSPVSSNRHFREFCSAHTSEDSPTESTTESFPDPGRSKYASGYKKHHRASMACINTPEPLDRDARKGIVRLSGTSEKVKFFKIGQLGGRTVLIYAEKAKGSQTAFKILEPLPGSDDTVGNAAHAFKQTKEFVLPFEAHDVQLHDIEDKLFILHGNRCEVLNVEDMKFDQIPRFEENREETNCRMLVKRIEESKLLSVLPITPKEYLFCYDKFAYCGTRSGSVIRKKFDKMIEWDGRPFQVTRCQNHVIAFSNNLIEVWDLSTSARVQIMHGKDIRCIYDAETTTCQQGNSSKPNSREALNSIAVRSSDPLRSNCCQSITEGELLVDKNLSNEEVENGRCYTQVERHSSDKIALQTTTQKHFESFHISIRDSGNVYRVFNMSHITV